MTVIPPTGSIPARTLQRWRIGLVVVGLLFFAVGAITLLNDVNPKRYIGIITWFIGALVIHDGIIAFAVFGTSVIMRRTGRRLRIPFGVILIVQGALVVGGIVALIVIPEILKQAIGSANETLLPQDYALHLVIFYAVLVVVTAAAVGLYYRLAARRTKVRPSIAQD